MLLAGVLLASAAHAQGLAGTYAIQGQTMRIIYDAGGRRLWSRRR
jgi:hypothetical protein